MKSFLKKAFLSTIIISLSYIFLILIYLFKLKKIEPYLKFEKHKRMDKILQIYDHRHIAKASKKLSILVPRKQRCLISSMVMKLLFNRKGIESKICIGVKKNAEKLNAHAWIVADKLNIGSNHNEYTLIKEIF